MKNLRLIIVIFLIFSACKTTRYVPPATSLSRTEYIATYSGIAIREMQRTGIPASIKMAQAILESGDGNSTLARRGNNHFGIKCHDWKGRRIYHDDDELNECFRRYNNPEESFRDHSEFLTGRARYASLFDLDPFDYRAWARGLKAAGYATNQQYDRLLIRIIEDNELYRLDTGSGTTSISGRDSQEERGISVAESREVRRWNRINYIIARKGDTYESLTSEMGLMRWEIARYNDLPQNPEIMPGDIIYLQPKRNRAERNSEKHVVKDGETMHYISQLHGVKLSRLLIRNNMQEGEEPSPGDTIYLRGQRPGDYQGSPVRPEFDL